MKVVPATVLREVRRRAGLSQREVARLAGLSPTVLSAYENGRREPSARAFLAVLTACGAELDVVHRWDDERNGRHFAAVMEMTDHLPKRPRGELAFPSLKHLRSG